MVVQDSSRNNDTFSFQDYRDRMEPMDDDIVIFIGIRRRDVRNTPRNRRNVRRRLDFGRAGNNEDNSMGTTSEEDILI